MVCLCLDALRGADAVDAFDVAAAAADRDSPSFTPSSFFSPLSSCCWG